VGIIVVDNTGVNQPNPVLTPLTKLATKVSVVYPQKNLGYFGGLAYGLEFALRSVTLPNWVVLSNTDLTMSDAGFLETITSRYSDGNASIVAPAILSEDFGLDENPYLLRRPSRLLMRLRKVIFSNSALFYPYVVCSKIKHQLRGMRPKKRALRPPRSIYAPHGSFLLIHESYFRAGGTLEYGSFLFGEEIFLAESAAALGLSIVYDPSFVLYHRQHASTGHWPTGQMRRYLAQSSGFLYDKYFRSRSDRDHTSQAQRQQNEPP
jgi:GT2 family glycosyltransferase